MTENKGLALEEMFREWIIPYIRKQLNNKDEIVAMLDDAGIKQLDTWYITGTANKKVNQMIIDRALEGEITTREQQAEMTAEESANLQGELSMKGNKRFIKPGELDDKK